MLDVNNRALFNLTNPKFVSLWELNGKNNSEKFN